MVMAELDGAGVAGREQFIFALAAAMPDRPDRMDHMPRRQPITSGDFGVAGLAAVERAAFSQQLGPGRAMDRAVHPTAAKQRRVGGVDDGINAQAS